MSTTATIQVHYKDGADGVVIRPPLAAPFGSLRLGPQVSVLVGDPDALDAIAMAATLLAADLREAQS